MRNKICIVLIAILSSMLLIQTAYVISLERNQRIFMVKQRLRQPLPDFSVNFVMQELPDEYFVTMYLPGLNKEEINLELKDRYLTVSVVKKIRRERMGKNYQAREVVAKSFLKVITLPEDIQQKGIVSDYNGGKLMIHIPKKLSSKKGKFK